MANYRFPQFNVEIINPTVTLTKVTDNVIDKLCSADILLTTDSTVFGISFYGYSYASDWNDTDIINWINNVELPQYEVE